MADQQFRHVAGLKPISKLLLELPVKLRRKYLVPATQAAARVVRDEAKAQAPEWHGEVAKGHPPPGTLKKAIIAFFVPEKSTATRVTFYVKPRSGDRERTKKTKTKAFDPTTGKNARFARYTLTEKTTQYGAFYWWWVEFGSVHNAPVGYMRKALDNKADQAITVFQDKLWESVKVVVQEK